MNKILQDNINKRKQRRSLLMKKLDYQKNNFVETALYFMDLQKTKLF